MDPMFSAAKLKLPISATRLLRLQPRFAGLPAPPWWGLWGALFVDCLSRVARHAQALPIGQLIPQVRSLADRHDVIGVGLSLLPAHSTARLTLPVVAEQHSLPPREVPRVNVPSLVRVRPGLLCRPAVHSHSRRTEARDTLRHMHSAYAFSRDCWQTLSSMYSALRGGRFGQRPPMRRLNFLVSLLIPIPAI